MFLYKMIWNTKQRNLADDKIMRSAYGLYLATISPPVCFPVYDTHTPLENFICYWGGYASPDY